jgi:hypothetical protein
VIRLVTRAVTAEIDGRMPEFVGAIGAGGERRDNPADATTAAHDASGVIWACRLL